MSAAIVLAALIAQAAAAPAPTAGKAAPAGAATAPSAAARAMSAPAAAAPAASAPAAPAAATTPLALPAGGSVSMDYLAADGHLVWVPAGNTGKVYVLDTATRQFRAVEGFATKKGRNDRLMGPSSVSAGKGYAYVGNRGDNSVCAVDAKTLEKKGCVTLPGMPDGTVYIGTTDEVWVTTPHEDAFQILDVKDGAAPKLAGKLDLKGGIEGYAVDMAKGVLYTNLEDGNKTLAIDVKSRKVTQTWATGCGEKGPRGLSLDPGRHLLVVACAVDGLVVLDTRDGKQKGHADAGEGVDNIDYDAKTKLVYAAAGRSERLTIAKLQDDGKLATATTARLPRGARVVVVDAAGTAFAADSEGGKLWVYESGK